MLNIKKIFAIALTGIALSLTACTDDNEADPNIPGSDRDKYVGDWLCRETVAGNAPTTFTITVEKHGTDDTVYVYNFGNIGSPFKAVWIISGNSITIPAQTLSQVDFSGSGFYSNNKLNLSYTSDGESVTAECTQ
jgi:hypothetical protein